MFFEFPYYKPHDDRISLWTESYGGRYGQSFARFFQEQNEKIRNETVYEAGTKYIHLDTVGIINGCIDSLFRYGQGHGWPIKIYISPTSTKSTSQHFHTYGIKAKNDSMIEAAIDAIDNPGGFKDQTIECQRLMKKFDSDALGNNENSVRWWQQLLTLTTPM